jgi:hypothetical protein
MSTTTSESYADTTVLANFKEWAQQFGTALTAAGWVQSSDTGQVVWSGVGAVPTAVGTFEIWRMNDSLAQESPCFLRLDYYSTSSTPRLQLQVSTATNGAGTQTGSISTLPLATSTAGGTSQRYSSFFSGANNRFSFSLWGAKFPTDDGTSAINIFFTIERSKNSSGQDTADFLTMVLGFAGSTVNSQTISKVYGVSALETSAKGVALTASSATYSTTGGMLPLFFWAGGKMGNILISMFGIKRSEWTNLSTATQNYCGVSTTYKFFTASNGAGTRLLSTATIDYGFALIWE